MEQETGGALASLLPFLLIGVAFWFLLIRPQRKRAQEAAQVRDSLRVGSEVITTAGLYGTVAHVDEDAVLLEVAPGVTNRYVKAAVGRIVSQPEEAGDPDGPGEAPGGPGAPGAGDRPEDGPAR